MVDESKTIILNYDKEGNIVPAESATRFSIMTFDENGNFIDHVWGDSKPTTSTEGDRLKNAASVFDSIMQEEMKEEQSSKGMGSK